MPELKSTYIGEIRIEVTGSYMLGDSPLGRRRLDRLAQIRLDEPDRRRRRRPPRAGCRDLRRFRDPLSYSGCQPGSWMK